MNTEKTNTKPIGKKHKVVDELIELKLLNSQRAKYSLIGLSVVFLFSLIFFLFSNFFTSSNKSNIDIRGLEKTVEKELASLTAEAGKLRGAMDVFERETATEPSTNDEKSSLGFVTERNYSELKELYNNLSDRKKLLMKELETLQSRRLEELKLKSGSQAIETVIATSITRIGAVFLAVFMMQILLSFYRYYMRLSNFYSSRVVAAKALDEEDYEELKSFIETLSIDGIDFGKEPQPPIDKIIELLKANR